MDEMERFYAEKVEKSFESLKNSAESHRIRILMAFQCIACGKIFDSYLQASEHIKICFKEFFRNG